MKTNTIGLLSLLVSGVVALQSCRQHSEKQLEVQPPLVTTAVVTNAGNLESITYSGTIVPDNITDISFAIPGTINKVAVDEGQRVQKGQFLASIDATEYEAALQIANASLDQTQDAFKRFDELYKKGSFPEKDYIDIKTKVAQAQANKVINKKRIADSRLFAPANGTITVKSAEVGGVAAPGVSAFTIVKTDQVYAQFTVPESEIGNFKQGMQVEVSIPALDHTVTGKISIVNPLADATAKTFTLKVRINNNDGLLLPGMISQVVVGVPKVVQQLTVPLTAIVTDPDNIPHIFVVEKDNVAKLKRVTVGKISGDAIGITDGIQENQTIIIAGQSNVRDGQSVNTGGKDKPVKDNKKN